MTVKIKNNDVPVTLLLSEWFELLKLFEQVDFKGEQDIATQLKDHIYNELLERGDITAYDEEEEEIDLDEEYDLEEDELDLDEDEEYEEEELIVRKKTPTKRKPKKRK